MFERERIERALKDELESFEERHGKSKAIYEGGRKNLLFGVPMNWQEMWPGGFPLTVEEAKGTVITDVDGNRYHDLCLGYSAALNGHTPAAVQEALLAQMEKGYVYTLPSENAYRAGAMLAERFGLPVWGYALSATDANRFVVRICRRLTGRKKILVFAGCYHGTVDECFVEIKEGGTAVREGNMGPAFDPAGTTETIEFNDVEALERALKTQEIACLLMEPVMTNIGIIHPEPGFMEACRKFTRDTGTILVIDEAHTITAGAEGAKGAMKLDPDMLVYGKCIGGGFPVGCFGMTAELAEALYEKTDPAFADVSGIGGTMTGSPMAMAAICATLKHHLTEASFAKSIEMAKTFTAGIEEVIQKYNLPFCTSRIGCRAEYVFSPVPARNAAESVAMADHLLYEYYFVGSLNRGYILSPYFNIMATFSAETDPQAASGYAAVFESLTTALLS